MTLTSIIYFIDTVPKQQIWHFGRYWTDFFWGNGHIG